MKKVIIISIVVHLIFLALFAPYLKSKMVFDEKEEAQRTEEVRKRELARQEYEKIKREKQKLDEKTARQLKKEAERKKREDMVKQTEELKKLRDEMLERQEKALAQLHERKKENVIKIASLEMLKESAEIKKHIEEMQNTVDQRSFSLGAYQNAEDWGSNGLFDSFQVYQGALQPPFDQAQPLHDFSFDGSTADRLTGQSGDIERGGVLIDLPAGGQAFQGDGKNARVDFWPFKVEENFTLVTRMKLEVKTQAQALKYQGFLANSPTANRNKGFRAYVEVTEEDASASTIVLETSGTKKGLKTRSLPDSFTFGQWHEVALAINRSEGWAKIYIDGKDLTAPEGELAEDFPTKGTTLDGTSEKMAENLEDKVEETPPTPENADGFKKDLAELGQKLDQRKEEHSDQYDVRADIEKAKDAIARMNEAIDALPGKTNMAEMNDTSDSVADKMDFPQNTGQTASPAELYQAAQGIEKQIAEAYADISAAKKAAGENSSFSEARESTAASTPARPDLASALGGQAGAPQTVGEFNEFRNNLDRASSEVGDMTARAQNMLGIAGDRSLANSSMRAGKAFASQAARQSRASQSQGYGTVVDMTSFAFGESEEGDSKGLRKDETGEGAKMAKGEKQLSLKLNENDIIAKALPGRRFTEESARRGWLYLDTWYVVGPWENNSNVNFEINHPPEYQIDFDAKYYDGKFANKDGHADQVLKWEFYQSDSVRCQPPRIYGAATYYAYTELWFEQAREMLIAVASDDAASMWLNDRVVWRDTGQSAWSLGEGYRRVNMRKGYNTLLVRIENGPRHCVWSVLLCPPEVLN